MKRLWALPLAVGLALGLPCPAPACSICDINTANTLTLRQQGAQAKVILYGKLDNPQVNAALPTGGTTDLIIERIIKTDPVLGNRKKLVLPRFVPLDPAKPPRIVSFCDVFNGQLDPYRDVQARTPAVVDYLRGAMSLPANNRVEELQFFFRHFEHADPDIARDAFFEFAKASDQDVGQVAATLAPEKLRAWIRDPLTPTERLNLYAFLLGACGGEDDARLLEAMIQKPTERNVVALGGILAGYVKMRPREGWDLCFTICRDPERPFLERLGAMRTMRFYHGWKPESSRREVLRCLDVLVAQGDMADLAFEDLRRWKYWELTGKVLAQWGKESHNAPILKRSLVRYALCCPQPEATKFIDQLKAGKDTRDMVQEVEESLQFEKQPK